MADLTVQDLSAEGGTAVTMNTAAAGGDKFVWDERAFLVIRNGDASSKTITITPGTASLAVPGYGTLTRSSIVLAVAAGAVAVIPPLPSIFKNTADSNKVAITYSAVTSVTVGVGRNS